LFPTASFILERKFAESPTLLIPLAAMARTSASAILPAKLEESGNSILNHLGLI
jgi:hypothetical protein